MEETDPRAFSRKFSRRVNHGRKLITSLQAYVSDTYEQFDSIFRQLLNIDEGVGDKEYNQVVVSQNVPKTDHKKNKILKPPAQR